MNKIKIGSKVRFNSESSRIDMLKAGYSEEDLIGTVKKINGDECEVKWPGEKDLDSQHISNLSIV